jgi:hypothetical protein
LSLGTPVFKEDNDENFSNLPKKMPLKKISVKHNGNIPQGCNSQLQISKFGIAAHKIKRETSSRHGSEQSQSSMMTRVPIRDTTSRLSN